MSDGAGSDRGKNSIETGTDSTLRLRCLLPESREDDLGGVLALHPTLGASLTPYGEETLAVDIYLDPRFRDEIPALLEDLEAVGARGVEVGDFEARDWLASYRERVRPFPLGETWWIDPHPRTPTPAPPGRRRLAVEPRMAFGTGTHPSTALMLTNLERNPPRGLSVLDVGTGSGILALAADSLGADRVVGFDIDLASIMVARQILRDQDFSPTPSYFAGGIEAVGRGAFDLILCNMISERFLPIAGSLRPLLHPAGAAVFSGILETEREEVESSLEEKGFRSTSIDELDGWILIRTKGAGAPR